MVTSIKALRIAVQDLQSAPCACYRAGHLDTRRALTEQRRAYLFGAGGGPRRTRDGCGRRPAGQRLRFDLGRGPRTVWDLSSSNDVFSRFFARP